MSNLDKTLDAFNESLHSRNIPLRLKKDASNVIEVELMEAQDGANERLLIAPGIITVQGGHFYIQDPDKLTNLYFNQQSRVYPLETSHGATVETITTISSNRYFKGDTFPTESPSPGLPTIRIRQSSRQVAAISCRKPHRRPTQNRGGPDGHQCRSVEHEECPQQKHR